MWTTVLVLAVALNLEPNRLALIALMLVRPHPIRQLLAFLAGSFLTSMTAGLLILLALHRGAWVGATGNGAKAQIVIGALALGLALLLTFPLWLTVNYLGEPDNGVILASYIGSWLMAGGFLALSSCVSALTRNQVVAFVLAAAVCFLFLMSGVEIVQAFFRGWAPQGFVDAVAELSFLTNFNDLSRGVIDIRDIVYFTLVIGIALYINTLVVETRKGA